MQFDIKKMLAMATVSGVELPAELTSVATAIESGDVTTLAHMLPQLTPLIIDALVNMVPLLSPETKAKMIHILRD